MHSGMEGSVKLKLSDMLKLTHTAQSQGRFITGVQTQLNSLLRSLESESASALAHRINRTIGPIRVDMETLEVITNEDAF